ncbi:hypothetical protein J3A83DRAFT_2189617 [Scleroderma citrinum]
MPRFRSWYLASSLLVSVRLSYSQWLFDGYHNKRLGTQTYPKARGLDLPFKKSARGKPSLSQQFLRINLTPPNQILSLPDPFHVMMDSISVLPSGRCASTAVLVGSTPLDDTTYRIRSWSSEMEKSRFHSSVLNVSIEVQVGCMGKSKDLRPSQGF